MHVGAHTAIQRCVAIALYKAIYAGLSPFAAGLRARGFKLRV